MYVNMTTVNVKPESVEEAMDYTMGDEAVRLMRLAPGFHYALLLEAQETAGLITSVTVWDTQAEADAWYTSPEYANLVKGVGALLTSAPERHHFTAHREILKSAAGV